MTDLPTSKRRLPGIGSHHGARPVTDEWLTPPALLAKLGRFDLDPCAPVNRPWDTAAAHYTIDDDGLHLPWEGRVWLNPPYSEVDLWTRQMAIAVAAGRASGIMLVFARCETSWWFRNIWPYGRAYLFVAGRLNFHLPDGTFSKAGHNSGGPSVLVAYSPADAEVLATCGIPGAYLTRAVITERKQP